MNKNQLETTRNLVKGIMLDRGAKFEGVYIYDYRKGIVLVAYSTATGMGRIFVHATGSPESLHCAPVTSPLIKVAKEVWTTLGVSEYVGSDLYPNTIIGMDVAADGKVRKLKIQRDKFIRIDTNGLSESQTYDYAPDYDGQIQMYTLRKGDRWVPAGWDPSRGVGLRLGEREAYRDPSV